MTRRALIAAAFLGSTAAASAAESWLGRWAPDATECWGKAALVATEKNLAWGDVSCRIGKIYRTGDAAHIQAHCGDRPGTIPISLHPQGDRLAVTWDNVRRPELRRCR